MQKYSEKLRSKVIESYRGGLNIKEICTKYSVSKTTIYEWLKQLSVETDRKNDKIFTYDEFISIKKQLEKTQRELEIIKETHCFSDAPRKEKEESIEKLIGKFPVKEMCRVLKLPTGTFYNYHFRRVKETQYQKRNDFLKEQILKIYNDSNKRFGATKIVAKLHSLGIRTSQPKVSILMKELNIQSKQCKKRTFSYSQNTFPFCKNYLQRHFNQTEPNKYWVGDITELRVALNKFYLCVIMDLFSRKIIAYRISSQNNTALAINTFKDAYENRNHPNNLSFHSDQGNPYISNDYRSLLKSLKVKQSFSNKANPYDNAVIESFFSKFKMEEANSHNFKYFEDLEECVNSYMQYYNDYRPHDSLKNKTPNQVEQDFMLGV